MLWIGGEEFLQKRSVSAQAVTRNRFFITAIPIRTGPCLTSNVRTTLGHPSSHIVRRGQGHCRDSCSVRLIARNAHAFTPWVVVVNSVGFSSVRYPTMKVERSMRAHFQCGLRETSFGCYVLLVWSPLFLVVPEEIVVWVRGSLRRSEKRCRGSSRHQRAGHRNSLLGLLGATCPIPRYNQQPFVSL
jgi:hypothetical protein